MKKIILYMFCFLLLFITGCELGNTPTSKVEAFLSDYQMLDKGISTNYQLLSNQDGLSDELQKRYQNLIEKQYKNLSYEVKEEEIDGDRAVVTVQIKVTDYHSAFARYNINDYTTEEYYEKVVEDLEDEKEKVVYTIDFTVVKEENGDWVVSSLGQNDLEKLLGMYSG